MKKIRLKDINFDKLTEIRCYSHCESNVFHDDKYLYKIFTTEKERVLKRKEGKVEYLSSIKDIDNIVLPKVGIYSSHGFIGCISKYVEGDPLSFKRLNNDELLNVVYDCSLTLRQMHNNGLIYCDPNFCNILCDDELNHNFIDVDGCYIKEFGYDTRPLITKQYLIQKKHELYRPSENNDRLTFYLEFLSKIFNKSIIEICEEEFDLKTDKIPDLKYSKDLYLELLDTKQDVPYVPYLDEIIDISKIKIKK